MYVLEYLPISFTHTTVNNAMVFHQFRKLNRSSSAKSALLKSGKSIFTLYIDPTSIKSNSVILKSVHSLQNEHLNIDLHLVFPIDTSF